MSRLFLIVALVMAKSLLVGCAGVCSALSPAMANPCTAAEQATAATLPVPATAWVRTAGR
jgi:hypothetical protein